MTLTERVRTCRSEGCKRHPAYADQSYCSEHQPRWTPEWRKRLTARDETSWMKAA